MAYTKTILPQNEGKEIKNEDKSKYEKALELYDTCLLYTSPSPRDCS